jgi:hypothetical protein
MVLQYCPQIVCAWPLMGLPQRIYSNAILGLNSTTKSTHMFMQSHPLNLPLALASWIICDTDYHSMGIDSHLTWAFPCQRPLGYSITFLDNWCLSVMQTWRFTNQINTLLWQPQFKLFSAALLPRNCRPARIGSKHMKMIPSCLASELLF